MQIIDGKKISQKIREKLKKETAELKAKGVVPGLAVILVGEDPASEIYVRNKEKSCEEVGIRSRVYKFSKDVKETEVIDLIKDLNCDESIDGILVQLPLPDGMKEKTVIESISPDKDVDGFCFVNAGRLFLGEEKIAPCTPLGVIELLKHENIEIDGKNCVVVGRSNIVGKPMASLLLKKNATVTIVHSHTKDISKLTSSADILIVAVGKPKFIKSDMVKPGAVVIDVGINRDLNNKIVGDVDFENVKDRASLITPVPGGVGPMTITMLLYNTITLAKLKSKIS